MSYLLFIWLAALDTVWSAAACLHTRVCSYNTLILTMLVSRTFCGSYERAERGLRMSNIFVGSRVTPQLHYAKMANYFIKIREEHDSLRWLRRKQRAFNLKTFASDCLFYQGHKMHLQVCAPLFYPTHLPKLAANFCVQISEYIHFNYVDMCAAVLKTISV